MCYSVIRRHYHLLNDCVHVVRWRYFHSFVTCSMLSPYIIPLHLWMCFHHYWIFWISILTTGWWASWFNTRGTGKSAKQSHKPWDESGKTTAWRETLSHHIRTKSFIGWTTWKPSYKSLQWKHLTKSRTQNNDQPNQPFQCCWVWAISFCITAIIPSKYDT